MLSPFLAMEVMERAFAMEREGVRVEHLEIGEPDFSAPKAVIEACTRALAEGETRYSDSRGLIELREAIARDVEKRFSVSVDASRVLVTSGTSPAMLLVFSLLLNPGDEVVLAQPSYPCYPNFIRYCGGVPVFVETLPEAGYNLGPDAVRGVLSERTRAILIGSPANPTGAIQGRDTVAALSDLGVPLISDEIYDGLVYDGAKVTSALEFSSDAFVLDGFSKRYAMTGFRLGWVIAPDWRCGDCRSCNRTCSFRPIALSSARGSPHSKAVHQTSPRCGPCIKSAAHDSPGVSSSWGSKSRLCQRAPSICLPTPGALVQIPELWRENF